MVALSEGATPMQRLISAEQVWREIERRSFAVLSYVSPSGRARSSGIVYVAVDHVLYVRVAAESWKARHIRRNPHVALNVTIPKRVPLLPFVQIPDATIAFGGEARVWRMDEVEAELRDHVLARMIDHPSDEETCLIEIRPTGHFATYGVGVSLWAMRNPRTARARVPVGPSSRCPPTVLDQPGFSGAGSLRASSHRRARNPTTAGRTP